VQQARRGACDLRVLHGLEVVYLLFTRNAVITTVDNLIDENGIRQRVSSMNENRYTRRRRYFILPTNRKLRVSAIDRRNTIITRSYCAGNNNTFRRRSTRIFTYIYIWSTD